MHPHIEWLGAVAADPLISNAACRLAVAVAASADIRNRYRGRSLPLAAAAQQSRRHQNDLLEALSRRGFLRVHSAKGGRLDIEIVPVRDDTVPVSQKPFLEVAGSVVGIVSPRVARSQARQEIEAAAKRRLADEYDSAQKRGEVAGAKDGSRGRSKGERPATAAEIGLDRKDIHDARRVRDVIAANPKAVREALDDILANGDEPTRAALKRATVPRKAASKGKGARPIGRRAQIAENAAKGVLPPAPDFSAATHARFRSKLAEIVAMVDAGDVSGLKAMTINPVSSSPKAMDKYRDLAVIALDARNQKDAA